MLNSSLVHRILTFLVQFSLVTEIGKLASQIDLLHQTPIQPAVRTAELLSLNVTMSNGHQAATFDSSLQVHCPLQSARATSSSLPLPLEQCVCASSE